MTPKTMKGVEIFCGLPSQIKLMTSYKDKVYVKCMNDKSYVISSDGSYEEFRIELTGETKKNINSFVDKVEID